MKKEQSILSISTRFLITLSIIGIIATLPFHYLYEKPHSINDLPNCIYSVFPKNNLTFSNTFINDNDIRDLIERYNNASFLEKSVIKNDPLFQKLIEKQIINDTSEK